MLLIVGLGNPTDEYKNTYHNMGFMAVDTLADKLNKKIKKAECGALTSVFSVDGEKIVLAKPMTYMNLSGEAVNSLMKKYKIKGADTIIIFDDFDLPRFSLRARAQGSGGSHNGMKNVIAVTGTEDIKRIRIGIGGTELDKKDYVLSRIGKEDVEEFKATFERLAKALDAYIRKPDFELLQRTVNS